MKSFEKLRSEIENNFAMSNKGQLGGLTTMALSIVVAIVTITAGALILAQFSANSTVTADTGLYNASWTVTQGKSGLGQLVGWIPLIIIITIAVMILGYFGLRTRGKGGA